MKKLYPYSFLVMAAALLLSVTLSAQETKVTVKVEKDGKMVKDTTYTYDDADQADHVLKMLEVMRGDDEHMKVMKYKVQSGNSETYDIVIDEDENAGKTKKITVMVSDGEEGDWEIITNDGEEIDIETIIKEHDGGEGEEVEVIVVKKKIKKGELHEVHEHVHDHDMDVEVEKEVKKKKSKKQ